MLTTHAVMGAPARVLERARTPTARAHRPARQAALPRRARGRGRARPPPECAGGDAAARARQLEAVRERYGDHVVRAILREAGEAVSGSVRGYDLAARVGPHGFGVLLPAADRAEA